MGQHESIARYQGVGKKSIVEPQHTDLGSRAILSSLLEYAGAFPLIVMAIAVSL